MIEFVVAKSLFSQDKALLTSKNGQFFINFWPQLEQYGAVYKTEWKHLQTWSRNLLGKNKRSKFVRILQSESSRHDCSTITRGGNAEKRTFDWVIAPLKYGCVLVEWILSFNKNISNFISDTRWRYFWYFKLFFRVFWLWTYRHSPPTTILLA